MNIKLPIVTIVGRQNVGKSTLFNSIIKEKKAIVDSYAGLTRDILSYTVNHKQFSFTLSDTPGLDLPPDAQLSQSIIENANKHLKLASVIVFLVEYPAPSKFDMQICNTLRKLGLPVIVAVNKMDSNERLEELDNFYELGFSEIIPISAISKKNVDMLIDKVVNLLPAKKSAQIEPNITISIIGKPNAGKSTLLNAFMGYDRAIVSDIPGTTRDSVDDFFKYHEKLFKVVDTAGIKKSSKSADGIEFYSFRRTLSSIEMCDVVIFLLDASVGLTEADKKIFDELIRAKKPIIIAVNKWDSIAKDEKTFNNYKNQLIFKLFKMQDFPIISISAKDRQRTSKLLDTALKLKERAERKIETPLLNRTIAKFLNSGKINQTGTALKIYYAAQINSSPVEFKFFVNNSSLFKKETLRFFEKSLQKEFDLFGLPMIIHIEGKQRRS